MRTFLSVCCFASLVIAQSSDASLRPSWDRTLTAPLGDISLSSTGRCAAISTSENIVVIDSTGRELWRWDFRKDNRFVIAQEIVLSPKCDWVAFVGDPGYRYVWIVHQRGRRIPIKTEGTPIAVAISHSGNGLTIGTGAGTLLSYAPDGTLQWKLEISNGLPIQEVSFADDDSAIMISGYGQTVVSAAGKILWSGGVGGVGSGRAARNFKTFVAWGEPPHGPGIGRMSLLDAEGKTLWTRVATVPQAIISPAGDSIVAQTNDNQNPSEEDGYSDRLDRLTKALRLLSRTGDVVRTYIAQGTPVAFSPDGRRFMLRQDDGFLALDLDEKHLWKIAASGYAHVVWSPDLRNVLVATENRLAWFSTP